jgi:N-formylglutamate amidohydrolase
MKGGLACAEQRIAGPMAKQTDLVDTLELIEPGTWSVPAIYSSPHSGNIIPEDLSSISCLTNEQLRRSEDSYVDELFSDCVGFGAPLLKCLVSRTYVDLNRDPNEFDQKLFDQPLPENLRSTSVRAHSGLGVIPRVVSEGEFIYDRKLRLSQAKKRMDRVYFPFHRKLSALAESAIESMGIACILDCHSMPRSATRIGKLGLTRSIDVVLGDRFGSSCSEDIISEWQRNLQSHGLNVVRNHPYSGGYITNHYGQPRLNRHALQIEINRSLYMDERSMEKHRNFATLQQALNACIKEFSRYLADNRQQGAELKAAQ